MTFRDLGLSVPILEALKAQGYQQPSPIQEKAIPPALEGRDVLGCAQTGTGKTCAFATPILQRLSENPRPGHNIRALILTPTRELAIQIGESFESYGRYMDLRHIVIFGGVSQNPQVEALKKGTDILVATPGRLMDLHNQGFISLEHLEIFVLDEADRMLDMGFIHDVKKILKWLPRKKQTLFFSATMPHEITNLVNSLLHDPVHVAVNPVSSPVEAIKQSVYMVDRGNKTRLLAHLIKTLEVKNALVFTRTKHGANKVARDLGKAGITAAAIHGNKSQSARQQALADFKSGNLRCLVATDIAARGLDIEELSHVFNYNLPEVPETYVHRIGRTGRAGRGGEAIAFCDFSEKPLLKDVEKLMGRAIPLVEDHPFPMEVFELPKRDKHGKPINEEDMEAREAARSLRKARDEAKAARKPHVELIEEVPSQEPAEEKKPRRRRRAKPEPEAQAVQTSFTESEEPVEEPAQRETYSNTGRPKLLRPGALLDTGDAMPCTEFHRPNPLDSDVIMDATARLLSSRRSTRPQMDSQSRSQRGGSQSRRRRKSEDQAQEPVKQTRQAKQAESPRKKHSKPAEAEPDQQQPRKSRQEGASARRMGRRPQTAKQSKPVEAAQQSEQPVRKKHNKPVDGSQQPEQAKKKRGKPSSAPAPKKENRRRNGGRRNMPPEPPHSLHKDSTEQPSLMKPYYLDLGR